jgi:hypothetical protein
MLAAYLKSREADELEPVFAGMLETLDQIAHAGIAIDALLVRAEGIKARLSRTERQAFEETWQTVAAMSREAWNAHESIRKVLEIRQQLADVEQRLVAAESAHG